MDKKFILEFSLEQVNLILQSLTELPYKVSVELINHIRSEAQQQYDTSPAATIADGEV